MSPNGTNTGSTGPVDSGDFQGSARELNHVEKVVAVISGKGGVGKSLVTSVIATTLSRQGHKVGILDADITGPSIPKIFGVQGQTETSEFGIFPAVTGGGIKIISVNLLLEQDDAPAAVADPQGAIELQPGIVGEPTQCLLREEWAVVVELELLVDAVPVPCHN